MQKNGNVLVSGRAVRADGAPAPGVVLLSYRLSGTVTDSVGQARAGRDRGHAARTDRDFWTFSLPSNANGRYVSFFSASDEQGSDPVQLNVQVAVGQRSYSPGLQNVDFKRLRARRWTSSCRLRVSACRCRSRPPEAGAVYRGLIVGVLGPARRDQAAVGAVAGRAGAVLARAAARRPRDDAALLGDQSRDVLDSCRTAGRTRESRRDAAAVDAAHPERGRRRARLLTRCAGCSYTGGTIFGVALNAR